MHEHFPAKNPGAEGPSAAFVPTAPRYECALAMSVWLVPACLGLLAGYGVLDAAVAGPLVGLGVLVQGGLAVLCAQRG
ncbi:MAG: hypothetical protein H6737_21335 [Alphaproteobacteria bacterium]|nr:hypothetical protein [Alphaproteobacteria bacterium]